MSREAWSAFWAGSSASGCLPGAPPGIAAALADVWRRFADTLPEGQALLDLATGNGAVPRALLETRPDLAITGIDTADPGGQLRGFKALGGVDAEALPFLDAAFAAVTSQFGVEYAGPKALAEAARVLARGGRLLFVVHHEESRAIAHNRARLAAMQALRDAGLFRLARQATAGLQDNALISAVAAAGQAHGAQSITRELPAALQQALGQAQPLAAVAALEAKAGGEIVRLQAMSEAARDQAGARAMAKALEAEGLDMRMETLEVAGEGPMAWVLEGRKP